MRPKSLILLMLALGCGLVASIGISQVMDRRNQQPTSNGETEAIFVAMKEIGFGDALNMQNLKLEPWPKHLVPPGALTKIEQVEGQLAGGHITVGEPVLEGKLMGTGEGSGPAIAIPKGFRVVSVEVDAVSSIGSLIKPGDRVDVLVFISRNPSSGISESGSKTILQDIKVFAVNEQWRRPEQAGEETISAKTVSLLVTPSQAEKVTLATEMGKLRLVLRSPSDDADAEVTGGTRASDIFASASDKNSRAEEGSLNTAPAAANGPDASGLLSWLQEQKDAQDAGDQQATDVGAQPAPQRTEQFVMELLEGSAVRTVEFQREGQSKWQNSAFGGSPAAPMAAPAPQQPTFEVPAATGPTEEVQIEPVAEPVDSE